MRAPLAPMKVSHGEEGGLSLHVLRLWQLEPLMSELDADPQRAPDVIPRGYNQKLTSAQANMEVVLGCKVNLLEFPDFLHSFGMIFASQVILSPLALVHTSKLIFLIRLRVC